MNGEIDIRSTMLDSNNIYYVRYDVPSGMYKYHEAVKKDIPIEDLPDEGTFYTLDNESIRDYRNYLLMRVCTDEFKKKSTKQIVQYRKGNIKKGKQYNLCVTV